MLNSRIMLTTNDNFILVCMANILLVFALYVSCKYDNYPIEILIFLRIGGMELYLKTLQTFPGETSVETKVLGLINNIAGNNSIPDLSNFSY